MLLVVEVTFVVPLVCPHSSIDTTASMWWLLSMDQSLVQTTSADTMRTTLTDDNNMADEDRVEVVPAMVVVVAIESVFSGKHSANTAQNTPKRTDYSYGRKEAGDETSDAE